MTQTALYRHFDAAGRLLYVGISLSAVARLSQHQRSKWAGQIARTTHEHYPDRDSAHAAEREAIRAERPIHNRERYGGLPPDSAEQAKAAKWRDDFVMSFHSPRRARLIAEGRLTQVDWAKWDAGGYGPDPFGIAARRAAEVPA